MKVYKDVGYMVGITRDIVMEADSLRKWDVGPYAISIPVADFVYANLSHIQCIPLRDPKSAVRTPHHHVLSFDVDKRIDLSINPSTCWGSMSGIVMGAMNNFMVSEFFRSMHIYVARYNPHSPLASVNQMAFARAL